MANTKEKTNVTRIKASDAGATKSAKKTVKPAVSKASKKPVAVDKTRVDSQQTGPKSKNVFIKMKNYFAGAWYELRQVRWPDRNATWSMTGALLIFTTVFIVLILLIDALFKYLFQLIIA